MLLDLPEWLDVSIEVDVPVIDSVPLLRRLETVPELLSVPVPRDEVLPLTLCIEESFEDECRPPPPPVMPSGNPPSIPPTPQSATHGTGSIPERPMTSAHDATAAPASASPATKTRVPRPLRGKCFAIASVYSKGDDGARLRTSIPLLEATCACMYPVVVESR